MVYTIRTRHQLAVSPHYCELSLPPRRPGSAKPPVECNTEVRYSPSQHPDGFLKSPHAQERFEAFRIFWGRGVKGRLRPHHSTRAPEKYPGCNDTWTRSVCPSRLCLSETPSDSRRLSQPAEARSDLGRTPNLGRGLASACALP